MGNLIESPYLGQDWAPFSDYLDGVLLEDFALSWDGPEDSERLKMQLEQVDAWHAGGGQVILVSQGQNIHEQAVYGLAAFLLVADGEQTYFRHASSDDYRNFWLYPDYETQLGLPLSRREQISDGESVIFERQFECGVCDCERQLPLRDDQNPALPELVAEERFKKLLAVDAQIELLQHFLATLLCHSLPFCAVFRHPKDCFGHCLAVLWRNQ